MYWFARFVESDQPLTPPGKLCWSNYRHSSCFLNEVLNNSESANTQHVLCKLQVSNQSAFSNNIRCPRWKCRSCQNGSPLFIDWLLLLIALPPPTLAAWFDLFFPFSFHLTCARSRPLVTSDNCILFPFLFFLLFKNSCNCASLSNLTKSNPLCMNYCPNWDPFITWWIIELGTACLVS